MFDFLIRYIRDRYPGDGVIPLHAPVFPGHEMDYVADTIRSTFVSSVGEYVGRFEKEIAEYAGCPCAVATVNGTAALHAALQLAGVGSGDLVVTQPLTFVATCNAIAYAGADPVFVDVDRETLGLSPVALADWLQDNAELDEKGVCHLRGSEKIVRACVPMHTFGHPVNLEGLLDVCRKWNLIMVEDAAESLGSKYHGQHTGTFGTFGAISFNGNKIITTGGGGMILCDEESGQLARHLTTTAKRPHPYEYIHDEIGYNYRMPNINAALGCAQLENLERFVEMKRSLAQQYEELFEGSELQFVREPAGCRSNYWLNAVVCQDASQREDLLDQTNNSGVMTRPVWTLMHRLPMFAHCLRGDLTQAEWLEERVVNLPSGVPADMLA